MSAEPTATLALTPTLAAEAVRLTRRLAFSAGALTALFCAALAAPAALIGSELHAEMLRSAVLTLPLAAVLLCLAAALATLLITRARFQASVLPDTGQRFLNGITTSSPLRHRKSVRSSAL